MHLYSLLALLSPRGPSINHLNRVPEASKSGCSSLPESIAAFAVFSSCSSSVARVFLYALPQCKGARGTNLVITKSRRILRGAPLAFALMWALPVAAAMPGQVPRLDDDVQMGLTVLNPANQPPPLSIIASARPSTHSREPDPSLPGGLRA